MSRRVGTIVVDIVLLMVVVYAAVLPYALPVAIVCDRGEPSVQLSSTSAFGSLERHRIGPCATYTLQGAD